MLWGCSDRAGPIEKVGTVGDARVVIQTDGWFPKADGIFRKWVNGGLGVLGDTDGDGIAEIIAASGEYPGRITVYSGSSGKPLWAMSGLVGKRADEAGEKAYKVGDFALTGDLNGDGISEVFVRNDWSDKEAFLLSGKDGSRILRADTGRIATPVRVYDISGDGVDDLIFLQGYELGVFALSTDDLSECFRREKILALDPASHRQKWLAVDVPDLDGDAVNEYLVGLVEKDQAHFIFLSGEDFSEIKRLPADRDVAGGTTIVASPGDLNGDGTPDLVITNNRGAETNDEVSYLGAVSGADGSQLWQVPGSSLPGGPARFAVDAKTGERRDLPADIGFGDPVTSLPDLDGDGAPELACALPLPVEGRSRMAVHVFSGGSGERLAALTISPKVGRITGEQMALVEAGGGHGPAIAVTGTLRVEAHMVAIFDLPEIAAQ